MLLASAAIEIESYLTLSTSTSKPFLYFLLYLLLIWDILHILLQYCDAVSDISIPQFLHFFEFILHLYLPSTHPIGSSSF